MTESQIKRLKIAEHTLSIIYWELVDNREDQRVIRRLDTILGKLNELKILYP